MFHGESRDAGPYRDYAVPLAQRFCMLAVAPYFDEACFPVERYQRSGIADNGIVRPQAGWTVDFIAPLAFQLAKQIAEQHRWEFNWRLFVVPGVAHSAARMFKSEAAFNALQPIIALARGN